MTKFSLFIAALTAFFALSPVNLAAAQDDIRIEDPYGRVTGPSAKSGAVFLTILNHSTQADRLIAARTDAAKRAELHSHIQDANGVMLMGEVKDGFPIAGMETHVLDRGGDHIMLLGLTRAIKPGDVLTLTLTFERGGEVVVEVPVDNDRAPAAMGDGGHGKPATN